MTSTAKLTPRQQQVLELVRSHIARTGAPPTRAEIAATLGFKSANAAEEHLKALARKGAIEMTPGASRGRSRVTVISLRSSAALPTKVANGTSAASRPTPILTRPSLGAIPAEARQPPRFSGPSSQFVQIDPPEEAGSLVLTDLAGKTHRADSGSSGF